MSKGGGNMMTCDICGKTTVKNMKLHKDVSHPQSVVEGADVQDAPMTTTQDPEITVVKEVVDCDCPCRSWGPIVTCPACQETYPDGIMTLHLRVKHGI